MLNRKLFQLLRDCENVTQHPIWHPEGNVLNHSLQTFNAALRESTDYDSVLAALLHDVGKVVQKCGHDKVAADFLLPGMVPDKTIWLVRNHMRVWHLINGEMRRQKKVFELANNLWFTDLILLARWDKRGRNPNIKLTLNEQYIDEKLEGLGGKS